MSNLKAYVYESAEGSLYQFYAEQKPAGMEKNTELLNGGTPEEASDLLLAHEEKLRQIEIASFEESRQRDEESRIKIQADTDNLYQKHLAQFGENAYTAEEFAQLFKVPVPKDVKTNNGQANP